MIVLRIVDLLELRKLKKARQGINAAKLNKGDVKKKKRHHEEDQGGLKMGASATAADEEEWDFHFSVVSTKLKFFPLAETRKVKKRRLGES